MSIRVGVIGTGSIAHMFHLKHYKDHPDVELAAVADIDKDRADKTAAQYGTASYASAEEMLNAERLDAVSVCTFNDSHVALSLLALERGLDVLVEKPMAMNRDEAARLRDKAAGSDRLVMVGMSHRYRADAQALQGMVASGGLGSIYYAKTKILRQRGVPEGWFTDSRYSGGGPLMDIGVHVLDLAWWMMGCPQPESVTGKLFRKIAPYATKGIAAYTAHSDINKSEGVYDVEDLGTAFITFTNGAVLTVEASWAVNGSQDDAVKVELYGTRGGGSLEPLSVFTEVNGFPVEHKLSVPSVDYYKAEIAHFIDCVKTRRQPLSDAAQGCEVVGMLEAIRVSSDSGELIRL
ncbi:Gfo/Idh/MocA family protein [Paenibacillus chitinolyticus]|uniref:Gfo/Idh/MocA family protein n=1 Tax=Paenibacillus chitinolyticus TaxID=79263 RepID=UPI0036DE400B